MLANTNRAKLSYLIESTFGVNPGTAGRALRMTGESLKYAIKNETSKELRADRMTADLIQVGAESNGGFNFELSAKEYDDLIEAALMGTWADYGTTGIGTAFTGTIDSTAGTVTAGAAPTGSSDFTTIAVGQWIRVTAPGDAADGAFIKVASRTTTVITAAVSTPIPGTGSRAAIANCKISASRVMNGLTERSFAVERSFLDVGQYWQFSGQTVGKMSLDFKSGAITTGNFDFMGKAAVRDNASGFSSIGASYAYDVQNAVRGVGAVMENGTPITGTFVKSLKFDLDNKLRGRDAIGNFGNVSIGNGTLSAKGTMEVYLNDGSLYDKFVNGDATSISWYTRDGAKNGYVLTFPRVKFSDAAVNAGGQDQDAMLSIPFEAVIDTVTNSEIIIDRLYAS